MKNSHHYWPIYFIAGMGIAVGVLGTIVFMNEYDSKEEEFEQLHKPTRRTAPNNTKSEDRLELQHTNIERISSTDSDSEFV